MSHFSNLSTIELVDLLAIKTEEYHNLLGNGADLKPADRMKGFVLLKQEIKEIQSEISSRALARS